jgi:GTP-binding protein HflX
MKSESTSTLPVVQYAVLIGVINKQQNETAAKEYLDELTFLAETYGVETKKTFTQKL